MYCYRRRLSIFSFVAFFCIIQTLFYKFYLSVFHCKTKHEILLPTHINDRAKIVNLNTRILCWIPTTLKRLDRAVVVHETWAQRCDESVFIVAGVRSSSLVDYSKYPFSIVHVGDENIEKYNRLSDKVLLSLLYLYNTYVHDYDWFFKGDDDTFVIVENLRHFLRRRPSNISFYYGYTATTPDRFYPSGGAGYILSQEALLKFGHQILTKTDERQSCNKSVAEDINLAYCLARVGIFVVNLRDDNQLETLHPMTFQEHFMGNFTKWIQQNAQFKQKKGEQCCSPVTISFHSLSPTEMKMMHFLLYKIHKAPV